MKQKQLLTSDQAVTTTMQHTTPCSDCPFARTALKGWLAGCSIGSWLQAAHSDCQMDCHTRVGRDGYHHQCAGAAIYRRNVAKLVEPPNLELQPNAKLVFASPIEFAKHHSRGKLNTVDKVRTEMWSALDLALSKK